jgi:hypothetical protein
LLRIMHAGVIAGAVVGTVGGLAISGLVAALLILRRHRQYRSTYAHPITGSTASPDLEKDVMFAGGVDQVHSDRKRPRSLHVVLMQGQQQGVQQQGQWLLLWMWGR